MSRRPAAPVADPTPAAPVPRAAPLKVAARPFIPAVHGHCHTAVKGEPCYKSILWAHANGIYDHPEWYPGLGKTSLIEQFQAALYKRHQKHCPLPCNTRTRFPAPPHKPWGHPSMFCFAVARVGYEMDIMRVQAQKAAGIFACDDAAVYSNTKVDLVPGVSTTIIGMAIGGWSKDGTAANSQTFFNAWAAVNADGRFREHDFVVKVDPDTVLMPDRLRGHLAPKAGQNVYFANCDKRSQFPASPDYPMMYGALEVLSRTALEAYLNGGEGRCKGALPQWQSWGEDLFMGHCMQTLGVQQVDDFGVLADMNCWGADCNNKGAAAFHHFKSTGDWLGCWNAASR